MAKLVRITETDPQYIENFSSYLVQIGAAPISGEPLLYQVEDGFDADAFHGLEVTDGTPPKSFEEQFPEVVAWLRAYRGTFEFYLSLKRQLESRGRLSEKQVEAVKRAMERDAERAKPKAPESFSIQPGVAIRVGQWLARELASKAGAPRAHYVFEVVAVHRETDRAYELTLKMSAQRTSACCVCGAGLTNPESVAAGIGPICGGRYGLPENNLLELAKALDLMELRQVRSWIPKAAIKERIEPQEERNK